MNLSVTSSPDVLSDHADKNCAEIILIAGPTASGKSSLALALCSEIARTGRQACIINADSMQVYQEMQVLTARPTREEVEQFPHEMHCPPLVVIRNLDLNLCTIPIYAASGHPNLHQTRLPKIG